MVDNSKHYNNAFPKDYMLDNFKIIRVLGSGGFGIAYLAEDTYLGEQCVIKEYMPTEFAYRDTSTGAIYSTNPSNAESYEWGLKEFLNEARTITKCKHKNIVEVIRFFEANNTAYIVMPYFSGSSLSQLLRLDPDETATEEELREIVIPLLEGLQVVHAQHIFHRDIKPSNIYICDHDNTPILIDFGAARFSLGSHSRSITTIVTPGYSPHEQYHQHGKQGAWTDIYSMGAVMYRLIDGKMPIESPARVGDDPLIPAVIIGKGKYSPHLLKAIDHALAFNVNDRPQSIEEWLLEINGVVIPELKSEPEPISEPISESNFKFSEPVEKPIPDISGSSFRIPTIIWIIIVILVASISVLGVKVLQKTSQQMVVIEKPVETTPAVTTISEPSFSVPPVVTTPSSIPTATECTDGRLNSSQIEYLVANKIAEGTRLDVSVPYRWLEFQKNNGEAGFRKEGGNISSGRWKLGNDQLCWCYGDCSEYKCKYVEAENNCTVWYYIDSETGKKTGKIHKWEDI